MAAAGSPIQDLCEEATCSICLEYFRDPVMVTECGHNFCRACLNQCWGEKDTEASCPECRGTFQKENLRPNRQLAKITEIAKKFGDQGTKGAEEKGGVCEKHQEPLKFFCKDHETPICVVCDRSKEHKEHEVVPLEEASQEYKDLIRRRLEILREERERILAYKAETEKENKELLKETKAERKKTVAQFRQLRQLLEEQEKLLLTQIEGLEEAIARRRDEHQAKLSEELSSLESLIQELEEKGQQPASELLQDVRNTLQRSEKEAFENPAAFPPELKQKIWDFHEINPFLERVMKQFQDVLLTGLPLMKANVTLDPDTAHPSLILSEDHKSVRWRDKQQDLPNNPERFDQHAFVLGREGFTAGRHFWEVSVGSEEDWAVGVTRKSVRRKGSIGLGPEEGIWVVRYCGGVYRAFNPPHYPRLSLSEELKRIRVVLNCAGGRVSFYDADRGTLLYTFSGASFAGETIMPFFCVCKKSHLSISP
ncbi:zinc finger protein RFP-like isoform X2 [Elgaria multicarinata webbii]|uniref:zinc finger protein RFP-like isoform X2 n=1 Tax=Elgaria multicarinata webbii TaxID=159646 RepID=UPI002FCCD7AE